MRSIFKSVCAQNGWEINNEKTGKYQTAIAKLEECKDLREKLENLQH